VRPRPALLRDPLLLAALGAALPVWAVLVAWHGAPQPDWILRDPARFVLFALVYPVLEELAFRGLVQGELLRRWPRRLGVLSAANAATSVLFATAHVLLRPSWLSAGTLLPSLVFGYFRERHGSLAAPIALHVFYNSGFLLLVSRG
jgi:uncharacterized protein